MTIIIVIKFQLDGNMGFAAALVEILVQSHLPGHLLLLPALSASLSEGRAVGLHCRGDVRVDLTWAAGVVSSAALSFRSPHPWNKGLPESTSGSGFVSTDFLESFLSSEHNYELTVVSPNRLVLLQETTSQCAEMISSREPSAHDHGNNYVPPLWQTYGKASITIRVSSFPCLALLKET